MNRATDIPFSTLLVVHCAQPPTMLSFCHTQENVLQRVLQLPVVSSTRESLQRTYASTKEAHPLVASVCEAYEKGMQGASSLAAWSMEPVVRRLEPQCESVGIFPAVGQEGAGHWRRECGSEGLPCLGC